MNTPAAQLDEEEDVETLQPNRLDREEIDRQQTLAVSADELAPCRVPAIKQWNTVFPNASCAVALIDRLTHHAEVIPIEGESYRLREAELAQQARRAPAEADDRKRPSKA